MDLTADQNTALLYFTLSADEEAKGKQLAGSGSLSKNRTIAQSFIERTYKEISKSGFPVVTFSSDMQVGDTFGERLSNAFDHLFKLGYENVIAIGNDCPQLSSMHIDKAHERLRTQDFVIGPAKDGGTYLIGINQRAFEKKSFSSLSWKTDTLLADLIFLIAKSDNTVLLLDQLSDVDDYKDLKICISNLGSSPVFSLKLLSQLLAAIISWANDILSFGIFFFPRLHFIGSTGFQRGPPY